MGCLRRIIGLVMVAMLWAAPSRAEPAPVEVVQSLYPLPNPDFDAYHDDARRPQFFTPRIHALTLAKKQCFRRAFGMDQLDFDYIVPGQDYDISNLRITLEALDGDKASVMVRFDNFDGPMELDYRLRRIEGRWLIDDTLYGDGSLSTDLDTPCDEASFGDMSQPKVPETSGEP